MTKHFWVGPPGFGPVDWTTGAITPHVDVVNTPQGIKVFIELAGVREDDIQLSIHNGVLTIYGDKHPHNREEWEQSRYLAERAFGTFRRSINLPYGLDEDQTDAHYENGVLAVFIPWKAETDVPPGKKIAIKRKPG